MTGTELATVSAVGTALHEVLRIYRDVRALSAEANECLRIRILEAQARGLGHMFRVNIEEIAATQRDIDSHNLSGPALGYAMSQLDQLNRALTRSIETARRGYAL